MSKSSAKSERERILTESDVNEMKAVKPEMMKRERERKRAQRVRAQDDADLSGAILNPLRSKSLFLQHASISLSFSPLWNALKLEREGRERDCRVVSERTISSRTSLSLNAFLQISFPIKSSLEQHAKAKAFLSRERKCLACVKWEIRNPRQSSFTRTRKQSESDNIVPFVQAKTFLKYKFLFTRVKVCVFMTFPYARRAGGDYFLFPLSEAREVVDTLFGDSRSIRV